MAPQIVEHGQTREKRMRSQNKYFTLEDDPVHNDFLREMSFYRQSQATVLEGYSKLEKLGLPTVRPSDYFAEMAKSDDHMQKVGGAVLPLGVAVNSVPFSFILKMGNLCPPVILNRKEFNNLNFLSRQQEIASVSLGNFILAVFPLCEIISKPYISHLVYSDGTPSRSWPLSHVFQCYPST